MSMQIRSITLAVIVFLGGLIINVQAEEPVIFIRSGDTETLRFAAKELQRYLEKITGEKIPINANASDDAVVISLESFECEASIAQLPEDRYLVCAMGRNGLSIVGNTGRGVVYAVYRFLERLGCRWYFPDPEDEIVPTMSTADVVKVIRSGSSIKERSDFKVRMYRFLTYDLGPDGTEISNTIMNNLPNVIDWAAKNRLNIFQYAIDHTPECYTHWRRYRAVFGEMRKRGMVIGVGGHCLFLFLPPDKFKEHPEWFPMLQGKRRSSGQFCTRNEPAVRFVIDNMIRFLKENPEIEYFAPWPNDTGGWCECPLCKDTPSADRVLELSCLIDKELKRAVPHVRYTHFAYGSHMTPPETQPLSPGMTVTICTHSRDLGVPFNDPRTKKIHREAFARWRELCKQANVPFIFHGKYARHWGLYGFHPLPLPILQEDCRWFRQQGLTGFELPIGFMGRRTKSFNFYVLAKLMWDADAEVKPIVDDYFTRCYADSAGPMRRAYEAVERAQPDLHYWKRHPARELIEHPVGQQYSKHLRDYAVNAVKILTEAQQHVQQARAMTKDNAVQARIDRFTQSLGYILLEWQTVEKIIEGAEHVASADAAGDNAAYIKELDVAEQRFEEAQKLSYRREEIAAQSPGCGLYWDVTGTGPSRIFKASQIDNWLKLVGEKRKVSEKKTGS